MAVQSFGSSVAQLGMDGQLAKALQSSAGINGNLKAEIVALTTVSTANATDLATAITLVNALKVSVNAIIAALKA